MKPSLCISFRFIQPYPLFHGRADGDEPEWPPSPMRAFQALLNAACLRTRGKPLQPEVKSALQTLEVLRPSIVAPRATLNTTGHRAYVPHNQTDLVTAAWARGNSESNIASYRMEKDFRPHRIENISDDLPTIRYLYPLDATNANPTELVSAIRPSVRSIHCLGWGIDQVIADATLVESASIQPEGERWVPTPRGGKRLRVHCKGSLAALAARHIKFLSRLVDNDWTPVPPLRVFDIVRYRSQDESVQRPFRVFELRNTDGSRFRYSHRHFIHIAGMVRHLAIEAMKKDPPRGVDKDWVETYIAGHVVDGSQGHRQLSYLPLPSIGHEHTDPGVRRVMIAVPVGDEARLDHVAQRLAGQQLKALNEKTPGFGMDENGRPKPGPILVPLSRHGDGVTRRYTTVASEWHSVTPVILPGHDDHKPNKTKALIARALFQSGVEQPCDFEWSAYSCFRRSYSAHKYDKNKRPQGYIRPNYLLSQTAVHMTLTFKDELKVPGPIIIGAGRHCGFGLMAQVND